MTRAVDIQKGDRFGKWEVQSSEVVRRGKGKRRFYECRCECGTVNEMPASLLNTGGSTMCAQCNREIAYSRRSGDWGEEWQADRIRKQYKNGASSRGIEWLLTVDDVKSIIFEDCSYCGSPPSNLSKGVKGDWTKWRKDFYYNGIDRKNNSIGYIRSNCIPCCGVCNKAKMTLSTTEFLGMCYSIVENNVLDWTEEVDDEVDCAEAVYNDNYDEDYYLVELESDNVADAFGVGYKGWLDSNA